jgi:hypothetical protein
MAEKANGAKDLTRALLLGASLGGVALVQVGCERLPDLLGTGGGSAGDGTSMSSEESAAADSLCQRALETENATDLEALLQTYPRAPCLNPTLLALPPATLTLVSPSVLGRLPTDVRNSIPARAESFLRFPGGRDSGDNGSGGGY